MDVLNIIRDRVNTQRYWRFHNYTICLFLIIVIVLCTWIAVYVAPCRNTDDEKHKLISAANDFCCTCIFIYSEIIMLLCMCKLRNFIEKSHLSTPLFSTLTPLPSTSSLTVPTTTTSSIAANTNLSNSTSRYKYNKASIVNGHSYCYYDTNRPIASTWSALKERTTLVLFSLFWFVSFIFGISVISTQIYFAALTLVYISFIINCWQMRETSRYGEEAMHLELDKVDERSRNAEHVNESVEEA